MKVRSIGLMNLVALSAAWVLGNPTAILAAETYKVDPDHSMVVFRIKHAGVSYTYGRFNSPEGSFVFDESNPSQSTFEVKIKSANVDTHNRNRDTHLKSPDFLNAKQFPTITFKSKKVAKGKKDGTYDVTGDLTLHGVTKSITIRVDHIGAADNPRMGFRRGFESVFTIRRSDFGMKNMIEVVGDEIRLMISLEGIRQ